MCSVDSKNYYFVQHSINTTSVHCFELTQIATQEDNKIADGQEGYY